MLEGWFWGQAAHFESLATSKAISDSQSLVWVEGVDEKEHLK